MNKQSLSQLLCFVVNSYEPLSKDERSMANFATLLNEKIERDSTMRDVFMKDAETGAETAVAICMTLAACMYVLRPVKESSPVTSGE